jgi:hypothetical protein
MPALLTDGGNDKPGHAQRLVQLFVTHAKLLEQPAALPRLLDVEAGAV